MADRNGKHLLFVWKPSGYELREADGDAPAVGSLVEVLHRSRTIRDPARTYRPSSADSAAILPNTSAAARPLA